jgi:sulfopyruvate decarboxylase TPP-binding subunit
MSIQTPPTGATALDGVQLADAVRALGVSHIICIPDTNLRTTIASLVAAEPPRMIYACTEDEAIGIHTGLYITGHKPMLLIQNNGLYACINTLKAMPLDAQIPTFFLIGQFGRDAKLAVEDNPRRAVHRLEPTLATWDVPFFRIESPDDIGNVRRAWDTAWQRLGPAAAIVGAPTR